MFDKRAPEFLTPLPITKTRAGMQVGFKMETMLKCETYDYACLAIYDVTLLCCCSFPVQLRLMG